jgi:hypothetical protein
MGLMWFAVGLIAGLSVLLAIELHRRFDIGWPGWAGLALGDLIVLFCIAWSTASVAEGEPRAASMGLIMFGGTGLIVLAVTWRLFIDPAIKAAPGENK